MANHLEQYKYIKWQIFLLYLSTSSCDTERHIHAPTAHTIMHNEISPSLYLRAAVLMINAPLAGKLFSWRKTRREEDTWNISLRPFLIIIIIIISSYCPIYPVRECLIYWQGGRDDIWKWISWEGNEQGQRNRHFLLKRAGRYGVLFLLSFSFGFICLFYYFCCFRFKAEDNRCLHLCLLYATTPPGIYFCMCFFFFLSLLSLCKNQYDMTYANVIPGHLCKRLDRIISLLCNSHNIIASIS